MTEFNANPEASEALSVKRNTAGLPKAQNEITEKLMAASRMGYADIAVWIIAQDMVGRGAHDYVKTVRPLKPAIATPKARAPRRAAAHAN